MSKKIIIGIDASRANTLNRTGVEGYVYQIIQNLKKIECKKDIQFLLYTREPLIHALQKDLPEYVEVKVLRWPPVGFAHDKPKRLWTQIRLSWEMLVNPPDVLFVPGHVFPIIHPKKTVMTVHDVAAQAFPESYNWFERWYSRWSAKVAVKKLWKVITISEFTKSELGVEHQERVSVIPLAYDNAYRVIDDIDRIDEVLQKYTIQKHYVLSVGRLETKKNTVRTVQAFNVLKQRQIDIYKNLQLVLVGGKGHGYEEVLVEIENSPYKKDILLPGFVDEVDLPYIMNGADAFVFPSLYEGFGIPILEAFACGTPVVTSNTSACKEVAGDAAVLVDPLDVTSIANGIEEAMRGEYVDRGLDRVKGYSWEKTAKETLDVLLRG
jgi:glycosyltransferase involved in cell wall biosynthesis